MDSGKPSTVRYMCHKENLKVHFQPLCCEIKWIPFESSKFLNLDV